MRYIGIDNGLDGGVVVIDDTGRVVERHVTPVLDEGKGKRAYDIPGMVRILAPYRFLEEGSPCRVFLERAQAMPKQGVSSTFSTGFGFGLWQGVLGALRIPVVLVAPRTWQDEMFRDVDKSNTKRASALVAARLSPGTDWRATERSRVPHDGLTDAFCIAEYGRCRSTQK
jgi:crossover junction endodeoxyribonuclease RuvC